MSGPVAVVHLDESCLGNGRDGATPGGAAALIEVRTARRLERRDFVLADDDTTNNRMALAGAIGVLRVLSGKGRRLTGLMVSDSQYLVKGMREWVPAWIGRGWRRREGEIENLALWQDLVQAAARHQLQWTWVRGHARHPKNEYADYLAQQAARTQQSSETAVASGFLAWLAERRAAGQYVDYDPDAAFTRQEVRLLAGERFALAGGV